MHENDYFGTTEPHNIRNATKRDLEFLFTYRDLYEAREAMGALSVGTSFIIYVTIQK